MTVSSLLWTLGLTVLLSISFFAFNASLEKANAVLAGTIAGSFPALVVIFSLLWFGETLQASQVVALFVVFSGMMLASIPFSAIRGHKLRFDRNLWYAVIAFFGWGIYFTAIRIPIEAQGWFLTGALVSFGGFVSIAGVFLLMRWSPGKPSLSWRIGYVPAFLGTVLTTVGTYAFSYAIETGKSSIVAPIAGSYPALYALLAYVIYRDRLERSQEIGVAATLIGVIALSILSA